MLPLEFAVIGARHAHVYDIVEGLIDAGAQLTAFSSNDDAGAAAFAGRYPAAARVEDTASILGLGDVQAVVLCGIPADRAAPHELSFRTMELAIRAQELAEARVAQTQ